MSAAPEKAQVTNAVQQVLTLAHQKQINIAAHDGSPNAYIAGLLYANFNSGIFNFDAVLDSLKNKFGVTNKRKHPFTGEDIISPIIAATTAACSLCNLVGTAFFLYH